MTVYNACVYIDGFNFYRDIVHNIKNGRICLYPSLQMFCEKKLASLPLKGRVSATPHINKIYLDIKEIYLDKVFYFTAIVKPTKDDPHKPIRQKEYNRALESEGVEVVCGEYKPVSPARWQEKQSDVNLATRFVYDVCNKKCNYAVIISNDTDFCGAVKFIRNKYSEVIVDVWAVSLPSSELFEVASICTGITVADFKGIPQIANPSFDPNSVKNMP